MDLVTFEKENCERIQAVETSFGPAGRPLSQPGRVLVGQGCLTKQGRRKPEPKVFFLFNDMLVYGSIILNGRWHKKQKVIPLRKQNPRSSLTDSKDLIQKFYCHMNKATVEKWQ